MSDVLTWPRHRCEHRHSGTQPKTEAEHSQAGNFHSQPPRVAVIEAGSNNECVRNLAQMELQVETETQPFWELQRFYCDARVAVIHLYSCWLFVFLNVESLVISLGSREEFSRPYFKRVTGVDVASTRICLRQFVWRHRASLKAHTGADATSLILQESEGNDMIWTVLLLVHALLLYFLLTQRSRWVLSGSISLLCWDSTGFDPAWLILNTSVTDEQ